MPKASPLINNFNGGEASPMVLRRADVAKYPNMCKTLYNSICRVQGAASKRPGTVRVKDTKDSTKASILIPFRYNINQNYQIEAGHFYFRFYANNGRIEIAAVPVEIATPYSADELSTLDFVQSNDVIYIVQANHPLHVLERTGPTSFTLTQVDLSGGPLLDQNTDQGVTVYASAQEGSITLTANVALFDAGHIGALIELQQKDDVSLTPWQSSTAYTAGALVTNDGKIYKANNAATSGNVEPSHDRGSAFDGKGCVEWIYQNNRRGIARITAVTSSTSATAKVESQIPAGAVGSANATYRWAFSALSKKEGYATAITLYLERMILAKGIKVFGSVSGDYENHAALNRSGESVKDQAFVEALSSDQANNVRWLVPQSKLLAGTAGDEFSIGQLSTNEAFGTGNIKALQETQYGTYGNVKPVRIGKTTFFVGSSGVVLYAMSYQLDADGYDSDNLNDFSDHILYPGVRQIVFVKSPQPIIWCLLTNGKLAALTYQKTQIVAGWHRHEIAGFGGEDSKECAVVESLSVIPAPDLNADELWMIVRRTNSDGSIRRTVEYMANPLGYTDDPEKAFHVDGGLTLNNTINTTLTPLGDWRVRGATVVVDAGTGVFAATDIGRRIELRWRDISEADPMRQWKTARATITAYGSPSRVSLMVNSAFPTFTPLAAGGWRMSVKHISGLDHYEGQTVAVWANAGAENRKKVIGGSIELDSPSSYVTVGLPFRSVVEPLALEAGSAIGTSQGKKKRVTDYLIDVWATCSLSVGCDDNSLEAYNFRTPDDEMDMPPRPFSGFINGVVEQDFDREALLRFVSDDPGPCTIRAYIPKVVTNDG